MKKFLTVIFSVVLSLIISNTASALILDFEDYNNLGVSLGGSMYWNSTGGGHLYMEQYYNDDFIYFNEGTYVNSFQMNAMPWLNYGGGNVGKVDVAAFQADNTEVWSMTIDLTNYTNWNDWLTVDVETDNITKMAFYSPFHSHGNGFWPSIDNMIIAENTGGPGPGNDPDPVPEPATMFLFSGGLLGFFARRKRIA